MTETSHQGARRPLIAGNWKMNGLRAEGERMIGQLADKCRAHGDLDCDVLICPPVTLIDRMARAAEGSAVLLGGQDCHAAEKGAHTGDISAAMLADAGATFCIVGHSERRADHGETNSDVAAKAAAVHTAGLTAIVCVGETLKAREAGRTLDIVGAQLSGSLPKGATAADTVIAYEPVWAIGTGRTPSAEDVAEVHAFMRARLADLVEDASAVRLLYGGSVKAENAELLMNVANVDGALVGGASLSVADFWPIVRAKA